MTTPFIRTALVILLVSAGFLAKSQQIYINEIMAVNQNNLQDDFFDWDDWFELYYPAGSTPGVVNLANYYVSDDGNNLTKWQIPDDDPTTTFLANGDYKLFWADKDTLQGADHMNFKFSVDGEALYLTEPDGVTIVDSVIFGPQGADVSYGRECDGCENWVYFNNTTPDASNEEMMMDPELLFINEVLAINTNNVLDESNEHAPWIEIYNPNNHAVNLSYYTVSDGTNEHVFANDNPYLTVVPANGFRLLWCDGSTDQGENHLNFTLNTSGAVLTLSAPNGSEADSFTYPTASANMSYGRQSDGSPTGVNFSTPTPRVTNSLIIVQPEELYINELMADNLSDTLDNYLELEDWIEIYNPNSYDVDIAGYFMSDNPENPMKWQVPLTNPDSTTVPAEGWLLFWADEDANQGVNHTSFRLNNAGENLAFYSPDGFSVADQISWSTQLDNVSFGRFTDGASQWVQFMETTPEASNNGSALSVEESSSQPASLLAYPNPVRGGWVRLSEWTSGTITGVNGQQVLVFNNKNQLNLSHLAPGIYILTTHDHHIVRIMVK